MKYKEYQHQELFNKYMSYRPNILWSSSIAGVNLPIITATRLKRMGYKRGLPDIMIFEPRQGYHGLFIEMKREGGRLTKEQKWFLDELNRRGYKAVVCYSFKQAIDIVENYLKGE
ncbi:MAG: VRR-NUC domain-containing protein [Thermoplasmata archaeon]